MPNLCVHVCNSVRVDYDTSPEFTKKTSVPIVPTSTNGRVRPPFSYLLPIHDLHLGIPYFVRVSAENSIAVGPPALSEPASAVPTAATPSPSPVRPNVVRVLVEQAVFGTLFERITVRIASLSPTEPPLNFMFPIESLSVSRGCRWGCHWHWRWLALDSDL